MQEHTIRSMAILFFPILFPGALQAQSQEELMQQHFEAARQAAGDEWTSAATYFTARTEEVQATLPSQGVTPLEPMRVFDNLYLVGHHQTAVWVLETSDGYVLIDSGYANSVDDVLLAGMNELGLDPNRISHVLLAHAHADHFGGAKALQDRFGARIGMSELDWDFIASETDEDTPIPARDLVLVDEQPLTIGGVSITPVLTPGHTPGSMGFIFQVHDGAATHAAALFGGTMLTSSAPALPVVEQYLESIEHFRDVTERLGVDVELHNHPLMDDLFPRLEILKMRQPGQPHPLVVGEESYQRFLTVMYEAMLGQLARRGELADKE